MDRLKAKQLLPILMAFAEGKTIEVNEQYGCEPHWEPLSNDPIWCKDACHYRIKPEPKYIPYTHAEAIENLKGRWVIRKSSGSLCVIAGICKTCVYVGNQSGTQSFGNLLDDYTFEDGSPCGKLVC